MRGEGYAAFVSLYKEYARHAHEHHQGMHVQAHMECFHKLEQIPKKRNRGTGGGELRRVEKKRKKVRA